MLLWYFVDFVDFSYELYPYDSVDSPWLSLTKNCIVVDFVQPCTSIKDGIK